MANLLGQDIGLNYKGLINIGSTINQNVSASLQSLTDGDGNLLPLQISTTAVQLNYGIGIGGTPTTAGLHVYGQSGKTGLAFEGVAAKMYIDLNGTGTNFFDSVESRFRNVAGTSLAMNVWGDLGRVAIGGLATNFTPSATLHVRGDGTNPVARFEAADGTNILTVPATAANTSILLFRGFYMGFNNNSAQLVGVENGTFVFYNSGNRFIISSSGVVTLYNSITTINTLPTFTLSTGAALTSANTSRFVFSPAGNVTVTSGTSSGINFTDTFAAAAGSANYRPLSINYTINNSGAQTGTMTGIFLNATETNLNGMTHNLMDLQIGGVSRFRIPSGSSASVLAASLSITSNTANSVALIVTGVSNNGGMLVRGSNFYTFRAQSAASADCFTIGTDGNTIIGPAIGATARLGVRGDGTNPIARFETSAGVERVRIASDGALSSTSYSTDVQRLGFNGGTFGVNRGYIRAESNGVFTLSNAAENDFGRLNYGLATSSFPALKRSTTILQARLADDSDFTFIQGKLRTETNFTSDPAIVANGYIVLYDLDGTAYKVLATAL